MTRSKLNEVVTVPKLDYIKTCEQRSDVKHNGLNCIVRSLFRSFTGTEEGMASVTKNH
jgi:hypothetical protein